MFHTGLSRYKTATVDNFTTDIGIKLRRKFLNKSWRKILRLCTKRKVIVEDKVIIPLSYIALENSGDIK